MIEASDDATWDKKKDKVPKFTLLLCRSSAYHLLPLCISLQVLVVAILAWQNESTRKANNLQKVCRTFFPGNFFKNFFIFLCEVFCAQTCALIVLTPCFAIMALRAHVG